MSAIIESYYKQTQLPGSLSERKKKLWSRHPDIAAEFENWIQNEQFTDSSKCLVIEGYTAEQLAAKFPLLNGEGAFVMLAELRESPEKAKRRLSAGFAIK